MEYLGKFFVQLAFSNHIIIYIFKAFLSFCEGQLKILKTLCPYIHYNISSVGRKEEEGI